MLGSVYLLYNYAVTEAGYYITHDWALCIQFKAFLSSL